MPDLTVLPVTEPKPLAIRKGTPYEVAIIVDGVRKIIWPPCRAEKESAQ